MIRYDEHVKFGYVYVLTTEIQGKVNQTIDLEANDAILLDVDKKGRILGAEFFPSESHVLKDAIGHEFEQTGETRTLKLGQKPVASTYRQAGVAFHFATADYTELVAIEIEDVARYDAE